MSAPLDHSAGRVTRRRTSPGTMALALVLLAIVLMLLFAAVTAPAHFHEYRRYLTDKQRPAASFAMQQLSQEWSEAELAKAFPALSFRCSDNRPGEYLDDRSCFADVASHNGTPAMFLSFFFAAGKLERAMVGIPWWAHGSTQRRLVEELGLPLGRTTPDPIDGLQLQGWRLNDGSVVQFNARRPRNPIAFNGLFWQSARACAHKPCLGPL